MTSSQGPDPAALNRVANAALTRVADGMTLGLGTGRAAEAFIERLGERVRRGMRVRGVATSKRSEELARRVQIDCVGLDEIDGIDVAFDGADEVTPDLALTKGLGGALLRERVVAYEAERFIILVTPEKLVPKLGMRTAIPIEIVPFAAGSAMRHLRALGGEPQVRKKPDGFPFVTDNMNWIVDTRFSPIDDPGKLHDEARKIPGVVDTGLFVRMADLVLVGGDEGVEEFK
ncbi:ribose-5-phosphate isomerase RpiA [Polyangium aurulentum]|uniref:ribose-5-phosphate isomerase RpiA n=1 Tax=Polyangium aurulentum TaxID=2567896 RepID=UPI0010AEBE7A|nr:ribose-5-phosphate isomerase RpiA [Polyangium aurulentum]UQA55199.1 ribose-5-phosphate isomerase RpiA [Polyangium aurulentum]